MNSKWHTKSTQMFKKTQGYQGYPGATTDSVSRALSDCSDYFRLATRRMHFDMPTTSAVRTPEPPLWS